MKNIKKISVIFAILAAALYALSSPFSKLLLQNIEPVMLAAILYIGAGSGIAIIAILSRKTQTNKGELPLSKKDLPYIAAMIVLDIAAPIFLMLGLSMTTAANASLLNNFEIAATSVIALLIFKEAISKRLWIAIALVTVASIILSVSDISCFSFSYGSIFVLAACICWGFENNCTRKLSSKNPLHIVIIKGFGSGLGSLLIAIVIGQATINLLYIIPALILGFFSYGLSIFFYIYAQRNLGAAKTSTYYALAPFIGTVLSLIIFKETPSFSFYVGFIIMLAGVFIVSYDTFKINETQRK